MRIKWKEDYSAKTQRRWGIGIGLLSGLVIGVPIGWGGVELPSDTSFVLALLTAIGTVGSVIVAVFTSIWFASREDSRREKDRLEAKDEEARLAALVSASLRPRMESIIDDVENVFIGLEVYTGNDPIEEETYNFLLAQLSSIDFSIDLSALGRIKGLPDDCADDIAAGLASLDHVSKEMSRWREALFDNGMGQKQRKGIFERWLRRASIAVATLRSAVETLRSNTLSVLALVDD